VVYVWGVIWRHVRGTALTLCGAFVCAYLLALRQINPSSQTWIRVVAATTFPVFLLIAYLLVHAIRAPWKLYQQLHSDHETERNALDKKYAALIEGFKEAQQVASNERNLEKLAHESERSRLERQVTDLEVSIGRPEISVQFAEPPLRQAAFEGNTMNHYGRESEFVVRNGSDRDAYDLFMSPFKIGRFTIQSRRFVDIPRNQEARLDYIVCYDRESDGVSCMNLEYRHHLTPLLDKLYEETGCHESGQFVLFGLEIAYKDCAGRMFNSAFTLSHCPEMDGYPRIFLTAPNLP
jgi:hypothetical protein